MTPEIKKQIDESSTRNLVNDILDEKRTLN